MRIWLQRGGSESASWSPLVISGGADGGLETTGSGWARLSRRPRSGHVGASPATSLGAERERSCWVLAAFCYFLGVEFIFLKRFWVWSWWHGSTFCFFIFNLFISDSYIPNTVFIGIRKFLIMIANFVGDGTLSSYIYSGVIAQCFIISATC